MLSKLPKLKHCENKLCLNPIHLTVEVVPTLPVNDIVRVTEEYRQNRRKAEILKTQLTCIGPGKMPPLIDGDEQISWKALINYCTTHRLDPINMALEIIPKEPPFPLFDDRISWASHINFGIRPCDMSPWSDEDMPSLLEELYDKHLCPQNFY